MIPHGSYRSIGGNTWSASAWPQRRNLMNELMIAECSRLLLDRKRKAESKGREVLGPQMR